MGGNRKYLNTRFNALSDSSTLMMTMLDDVDDAALNSTPSDMRVLRSLTLLRTLSDLDALRSAIGSHARICTLYIIVSASTTTTFSRSSCWFNALAIPREQDLRQGRAGHPQIRRRCSWSATDGARVGAGVVNDLHIPGDLQY